MDDGKRAIGIFDSGVGGLTVLRQIMERLPHEGIVYLGDTARVPYGTKSAETVVRYARACAGILLERDIKLLVVACNTASAYALPALQDELEIPVLGVIEPGARCAAHVTRNRRIGVIGTAGTIRSGQYVDAIQAVSPEAKVFCKACPLLVPLVEEGWTDGEIPEQIARTYLTELLGHGIDTLVLGCTHYPLLKKILARIAGENVTLVDSAETTSEGVAEILAAMDIAASAGEAPKREFLVSDAPDSFAGIGRRFLACDIDHVEWVDF